MSWGAARTLASVCTISSGGTPSRRRREFWGGDIPWLTTSATTQRRIRFASEHITKEGLANSSAKRFPRGTILVAMYGQGRTRGQAAVLEMEATINQAFAALIPGPDVDGEFLFQYLEHSYEKLRGLSNMGGQDNLSLDLIRTFPIPNLPTVEQRKIAAILRTWDDAIDGMLAQRESASSRYLSTANALAAPNRQNRRLGEVTQELTSRNTDGRYGRSDVMGVSNRHGIVPMRAQSIAKDLSRYQVLPPRAFAYNPMRIDVGSIAMSRLDAPVIVSPDYVLFACDAAELLPEYLDHVLNTRRWRHDVSAGASGSVRTRTYYEDLATIQIHLPPPAEQATIAGALDAMRDEIALLDRQVELLREQKRGLAQKLLSGELRVEAGDRRD